MLHLKKNPLRKYIRNGKLPHFFCPGCGCGQILNYFLKSVDDLKLDFKKIITIGGVGCTARIPVYLNTDSFHGVHGRTLAWATGIKTYQPDLKVVIFAGDFDIGFIPSLDLIHLAFICEIKLMAMIGSRFSIIEDGLIGTGQGKDVS